MKELEDQLMGVRIREADTVAELKEMRQKVMELETQVPAEINIHFFIQAMRLKQELSRSWWHADFKFSRDQAKWLTVQRFEHHYPEGFIPPPPSL